MPYSPAPAQCDSTVMPLDLTVIILTFNEAIHIERSIASVKTVASKVLVVDSFSTDGTVHLAEQSGARVLHNKFVNYSKQFQWALDHGGIDTTWIMRLDADEVIEADLLNELQQTLPTLQEDVVGINFDRKHIFMGRWIRHGGRYPLRLLRVWRRGNGRIEDRWMDEHIVTWGGAVINMKGGFSDANENDLSFFTEKHNKYATREAVDVLNQRYGFFRRDESLTSKSASRQAGIKRWIKESLYNKIPFWAGPFGYFIYRYFFQAGFLDGKEGLIYHFLQGFWYRFLVGAKLIELEELIAHCQNNDERRDLLSQHTGFKISEQ